MQILALYPGGIPRSEPPSCEAPRQPTIHEYKYFVGGISVTKKVGVLNNDKTLPREMTFTTIVEF